MAAIGNLMRLCVGTAVLKCVAQARPWSGPRLAPRVACPTLPLVISAATFRAFGQV